MLDFFYSYHIGLTEEQRKKIDQQVGINHIILRYILLRALGLLPVFSEIRNANAILDPVEGYVQPAPIGRVNPHRGFGFRKTPQNQPEQCENPNQPQQGKDKNPLFGSRRNSQNQPEQSKGEKKKNDIPPPHASRKEAEQGKDKNPNPPSKSRTSVKTKRTFRAELTVFSSGLQDYSDRARQNSNVAEELDSLKLALNDGRFDAGLGSKKVKGNIFEMRGPTGARVYFKYSAKCKENATVMEIIGESNKRDQNSVIDLLDKKHN